MKKNNTPDMASNEQFSKTDEPTRARPRYGSLVNEQSLLHLLEPAMLTLSSPACSKIYARRHSTSGQTATIPVDERNYMLNKGMPPPVPIRLPVVPKRSNNPNKSAIPLSIKDRIDKIPQQVSVPRVLPHIIDNKTKLTAQSNYSTSINQQPPPSFYKREVLTSRAKLSSILHTQASIDHQKELVKIPPAPAGPPPPAPKLSKALKTTTTTINTTPISHATIINNINNTNNNSIIGGGGSMQQQSKGSIRQDSSVSSDSFSQTSSPSYTNKTMETPLLPPKARQPNHHSHILLQNNLLHHHHHHQLQANMIENGSEEDANTKITKSVSTPASLQAVVRFHNGSNMSLHHRIIRDMRRRSSANNNQTTNAKFRYVQILFNVLVLISFGTGLAIYFQIYPLSTKISNSTSVQQLVPVMPAPPDNKFDLNPAPGVCLPVIVEFCQQHNIPYNYTVFPNYMGHFGQRDAEHELEIYDAVVDVRCYELSALFLCSVFVPKCGPSGAVVRPCRNLCTETKRRCGFFLDVFGLGLPDYLVCDLFPETTDENVCVGHREVKQVRIKAQKPVCPNGFQCDSKRCLPKDWQCDGHIDCKDQTDELNCKRCSTGMIHCGGDKCITQEHMCDGKKDCPWGQDERNCLRLSERNGDEGRGQLQIYRPDKQRWAPACVGHWDRKTTPKSICSLLGYSRVNASRLLGRTDLKISSQIDETPIWKLQSQQSKNLIRDFGICEGSSYVTAELICTNYMCGKARKSYAERHALRIVGGVRSKPGDWPFLAALLGGPEEIFYCAGVLIADQWVLTASHCVGNYSNVNGWTIQLGITRRHAHSFYGQKMKVKRVVPHPLYNLGIAHDNDVALLQLSSRVTFHEHLLPVCLPPAHKLLHPGTICTVIGWGKKEDTGISEYEPEVNEAEVPVLHRDLCNSWLENRELNVTEGMICAGYKEGGKDACQGDSGGPLLCRDDSDSDRWFVGGIVSWGIKCAHPHLPGVYAYVPKYIPWIMRQMELYSN